LILYNDGITPGGVLVAENRRKSVVWYASFLEFGRKLACEEAWITLAIARTCSHTHPNVYFAFPSNGGDDRTFIS
jgi:hypothetical protein